MTRLVAPLAVVSLCLSSTPAAAADPDSTSLAQPTVSAESTSQIDLGAIQRSGIYRASSAMAAADTVPATLDLTPAASARPSVLTSMYVGLVALQAYDVYSTHVALKQGAQEQNPLFTGALANPAAQIAIKSAATAFSIYAAERLWRRNQRVAAIVLMGATNGLMAMVAANNASVIRGQR